MKAIITNVKKGSGHSKYNGLTFPVKEVLSGIVCVLIPSELDIKVNDSVDFSFNEITIVDINEELQKAYDNKNWGSDNNTFANLVKYVDAKGIKAKTPIYNCPA